VTITRVPVGGEGLAQGQSKKKKKKKGKGGDEEEGEGTEKKSKKEKNEIDDSAIEDTSVCNFNIIVLYASRERC
jgi:hypothetical protein